MCLQGSKAQHSTAPTETPVSERYQTTIPYTPLPGGQMLVQVQLGGGLTGTFLLDTGFSRPCVTDALAAKMGLTPIPAVGTDGKPITFYAGKQAQMVTVPLLQLSNFRIFNSFCLVLSQKSLSSLFGQQVDGILSARTLIIYPMCFDFARHQITMFSPSPLTSVELRSIGMEDAVSVSVTKMSDGGLSFSCPVDMSNGNKRVQENLLIDTGGTNTTISEVTAHYLGLKPITDNRNSPTLFGNIIVKQVYLPMLSLGSQHVDNLPLVYTRNLSDSFPAHIGLDVLSQFRVLLDFKQQKMYLKSFLSASQIQEVPKQGLPQASSRAEVAVDNAPETVFCGTWRKNGRFAEKCSILLWASLFRCR